MFRRNSQGSFLSPDGRRVTFIGLRGGNRSLWVRELDALEASPLPGTEDADYPFWSPDSRTIAFFSGGALKAIDAAGGPVRTLCAAPGVGRGGAWSREGLIVFGSLQGVLPFPPPEGSRSG